MIDERLGELLWEIEHRAADAKEAQAEAARAALARRRQWEAAMAQARRDHEHHHREQELNAQIERWRAARDAREFARAMIEARPNDDSVSEWVNWVTAYAEQLDPFRTPPGVLTVPEPSEKDLRPFLGRWSPYGPDATYQSFHSRATQVHRRLARRLARLAG